MYYLRSKYCLFTKENSTFIASLIVSGQIFRLEIVLKILIKIAIQPIKQFNIRGIYMIMSIVILWD